jgi:hypothetical protein
MYTKMYSSTKHLNRNHKFKNLKLFLFNKFDLRKSAIQLIPNSYFPKRIPERKKSF